MKNEKKSIFAQNLIAIRKSKGLSQRDLAKLSGISNRMIGYYETNSVIPPINKLEKLANALDVSVSNLLDRNLSNKKIINIDTRTIKKIRLLEKLPAEDQRKAIDYINALIAQQENKTFKNQLTGSTK
ncbi:MAG: helix-turn-helix transcriptional regulator [Spirochaetes bacterium]|nr:helix-turn-helix transcriptional regulator [Spirochaetota bacterium]